MLPPCVAGGSAGEAAGFADGAAAEVPRAAGVNAAGTTVPCADMMAAVFEGIGAGTKMLEPPPMTELLPGVVGENICPLPGGVRPAVLPGTTTVMLLPGDCNLGIEVPATSGDNGSMGDDDATVTLQGGTAAAGTDAPIDAIAPALAGMDVVDIVPVGGRVPVGGNELPMVRAPAAADDMLTLVCAGVDCVGRVCA